MSNYLFALGTNHSLCKVDILNVLSRFKARPEILEASEEVLIVDVEGELDIKALMAELGSAVKVALVFDVFASEDFLKSAIREFSKKDFLDQLLPKNQKKATFGISVYHGGGEYKALNETWHLSGELNRQIKDELIASGIDAGYVRQKERVLSSVSVKENGLLDRGFELVLAVGESGVWVGKTLAVQDYESYSQRDYGRPERDAESGMIPPKVARMMINLLGVGKEELILDPFCGSGTFLQELVILGYKNLIGSDVSQNAISATQKNIDWLFANFPDIKKTDFRIKLIESDARALSKAFEAEKVGAIVTEPYLGPTGVRYFSTDRIKKEIGNLESLYSQSFGEFNKILKKGGKVVIIFPVFRYKDQFFKLEILEQIKKMGYGRLDFLPSDIDPEKLDLQITDRNSIIFFRPGQAVSREILLFIKR